MITNGKKNNDAELDKTITAGTSYTIFVNSFATPDQEPSYVNRALSFLWKRQRSEEMEELLEGNGDMMKCIEGLFLV